MIEPNSSRLTSPTVAPSPSALRRHRCLLFVIWRRAGRLRQGDVFRASRLSSGNRLFPTQVLISPTSVVHYTPEWFGRLEHSMHMAHVASVRIDTNLMFSDVYIETTGGASPIRCHGHRKADAVRMKQLIERYQTDYYRGTVESSEPRSRSGSGSIPFGSSPPVVPAG